MERDNDRTLKAGREKRQAPSAFFAQELQNLEGGKGPFGFFSMVLENMPGYIVCFDQKGNPLYANCAYVIYNWRDFGKPEFSFFSQFTNDELEELASLFGAVADNRKHSFTWLSRKARKDVVVEWKICALPGDFGCHPLYLAIGTDVTMSIDERERLRVLLDLSADQNLKLKSFTHIVSHHIRSHAVNILGLVELLDDPEESAEEKKTYTDLLRLTADQLDQTICNLNQVIDIQDSVAKSRAVRNLAKSVQRMLQLMGGQIDAARAKVDIRVSEDLWVDVVPSYLNHILLNLLSNALKFKSPLRTLEVIIAADRRGNEVVLEVIDNGLGIDLDKFKDRIFEFYETFHRAVDSRGFGLYITKQQVKAMGGHVEVESVPGKGSTFRVFFKSA